MRSGTEPSTANVAPMYVTSDMSSTGTNHNQFGFLDLVDDAGEVAELRQQEVHDQDEHHQREDGPPVEAGQRGELRLVDVAALGHRVLQLLQQSLVVLQRGRVVPLSALSCSTWSDDRTGSTPSTAIAESTAASAPTLSVSAASSWATSASRRASGDRHLAEPEVDQPRHAGLVDHDVWRGGDRGARCDERAGRRAVPDRVEQCVVDRVAVE